MFGFSKFDSSVGTSTVQLRSNAKLSGSRPQIAHKRAVVATIFTRRRDSKAPSFWGLSR
jgi:hypothetical protein